MKARRSRLYQRHGCLGVLVAPVAILTLLLVLAPFLVALPWIVAIVLVIGVPVIMVHVDWWSR